MLLRCARWGPSSCRAWRRGVGSTVDSANQELASFFGASLPAPDLAVAPDHSSEAQPAAVLSHVDSQGRLGMVDVGHKTDSQRTAVASARVELGRAAFERVAQNKVDKGDVLVVAQLAGIQAAKLTAQLIPLCHSLNLNWVQVGLSLDHQREAVNIRAEAQTTGATGVEMEALTAAAVAGLTVYDMVKAVDRGARLTDVQLEHKAGGKSGTWTRGS